MDQDKKSKPKLVENEEKVLEFWNKNQTFKKSLEKSSPKGEFVFYDGPPFATGLPHYGHILAGTIKDVLPRYKTMQGYHVPRRWGWDCHGLPIENIVEKELELKSKKDIENFGIEKFNSAAREAVMRYADEWRKQVPRFGRWVDMDDDYRTMDSHYTESVWWVFKELHDKGLIYEGYKSMHICPRCETTLSNFEVTQGYKDITDISVYVKFKLNAEKFPNSYLLVWTTTPWTLPGNVAVAVSHLEVYGEYELDGEKGTTYFVAEKLAKAVFKERSFTLIREWQGDQLIGATYKPPFDYYITDENILNKKNGWQVYTAPFVTAEDGTGIVHIAPAFGEDDMNLGNEHALPFVQHVGMNGKFRKEVKDFPHLDVKPKEDTQKTDVEVIKWLAHNNLLFEKKKIIHPYPHCWRCETPLLNYAASSWFVKVTDIKNKLLAENKKTTWVPSAIGEGRFGKWLEGARDWAISRTRYWGAPLPVWRGADGEVFIPAKLDDLKNRTKASNTYIVIRHGEADSNVNGILSSGLESPHGLTEKGRGQVIESAKKLKSKKIDFIVYSPVKRAKETAFIVAKELGMTEHKMIMDERLKEVDFGYLNGKPIKELSVYKIEERFEVPLPGGESYRDISKRVTRAVESLEKAYKDKTILLVTHDTPAWLLFSSAEGLSMKEAIALRGTNDITIDKFIKNAETLNLKWKPLPRDNDGNINLHRPYIDEIVVYSDKGKPMTRVSEVFDCWFESGSMPYGEARYTGKSTANFNPKSGLFRKSIGFPADFIAEGLDQTRGWFYSMMVLGVGLFGKSPFKNVIVNGTVLAEDGRKMSKSLKNYPDPMVVVNTYGMDAVRYYMLSSPAVSADDFCFSEKGVDEVAKKLLQRLDNVISFYEMYSTDMYRGVGTEEADVSKFDNVLDKWILARLGETIKSVTENLEKYQLDKASRPLMDFVDDLSNWYLRRSRDRFKSENIEDKNDSLNTTRYVLREFSKLMAPFTPFFAEYLYQKVKGSDGKESVHLESWSFEASRFTLHASQLIEDMKTVRKIATLGLEARMKAGLKVRQPLKELRIKNKELSKELFDLVRDELNVKEVVFDGKIETEVLLDTTVTPELKEEGDVRELLRSIQDLRKTQGFKVGEMAKLIVDASGTGKILVEKYLGEIKKGAQLRDVILEPLLIGEEIKIADFSLKIKLEK